VANDRPAAHGAVVGDPGGATVHIDVPHRCGRTHHGYQSLAECCWPEAAYLTGDGPFAVLARCGLLSVSLYPTRDEAQRRLRRLVADGCGRGCEGRHDLVDLGQPEALTASWSTAADAAP